MKQHGTQDQKNKQKIFPFNFLQLAVLLLAGFLILSCTPRNSNASKPNLSQSSTQSSAAASESIVFARPNNMVGALAYLAEAKGFFKEEGLDVSFETVTNAKISQDLMVAGKADFSTGAEGPFTYLSFQQHPLLIVAEIGKNPETAIFVRKDHGIEKPQDLKGKKVAYLPGTVSYFYLVRFLDKYQMSMKDLQLVPMQPPSMPQALLGGTMDAFVMWEPWGSNALQAVGERGMKMADPSIYSYRALLTTTQTMVQKRPEVIKQVIRALLKAEAFIHTHREESIKILSEGIHFEPSVLETYWDQYEFRLHLDAGLIQLMEENAKYLQRDDPNFTGQPMPHFRASIDEKFLKEIDPARVNLP